MSLINQMLKDLDARHEADARGRLHREVRALPEVRDNRGLRLAIVGLLALLVAAVTWWVLLDRPTARPDTASANAPPVATLAAKPAAPEIPNAGNSSAVPDRAAQDAEKSLRLSAMLDKRPTYEPAPAKAPPANAAISQKGVAVNETVSGKTILPAPAPKGTALGVIEKSPVAKTPRERMEAEYRHAVSLVNGARISEATDVLLEILRQDGGHTASRQLLARLLIEQRRSDEAMAILAEGLASQPGQVQWAMTLARLQVDRGDLDGAARTLQNSQPFAANNADYQGFAGHVQHRLGHAKAAVDFYQAAVRLAPFDGRWWLGLGLALEADQRATEAREAFLRARASGSLNPDLAAVVDQKLR